MRLSEFERRSISEVVHFHLPDARILLFGSRVDDTKRGGDIDLLIVTQEPPHRSLKWDISDEIQARIGAQKIDVVIELESGLSSFARSVLPDAIFIDA